MDRLTEVIEELASSLSPRALSDFSFKLTSRYRSLDFHLESKEEYLAYLVARLPATYSVVSEVLSEINRRVPLLKIRSLLDLGAGPGTGLLAASEVFESLESSIHIEQDKEMVRLGRQIIESLGLPQQVDWMFEDLSVKQDLPAADLVLFSYSLGELDDWKEIVKKAWKTSTNLLCLIEPGTPRGFERIRAARDLIIQLEGKIVAPCPHIHECPMKEGDWCHFSKRVQRTALHRRVKGATLGYEDEKYSYVVFTKNEAHPVKERILRHPKKGSGFVSFELCALGGLKKETISRKDGPRYKKARKLHWGDALPCSKDPS